jgi:hypothetical protein
MYVYRKIRFSIKLFVLLLPIVGSLILVSLLIEVGYDEGMISGFWAEFAHYSFYLFRFPSHNLIWETNTATNPLTFMGGLCINVLFNSLILTLIISNIKGK